MKVVVAQANRVGGELSDHHFHDPCRFRQRPLSECNGHMASMIAAGHASACPELVEHDVDRRDDGLRRIGTISGQDVGEIVYA
jgi:hypothetical protein